jgi:hypothetical protein
MATKINVLPLAKMKLPSSGHYSTVKTYRVSLSSSLRAPQTYGTDSLHLLRFPVTTAVPKGTTKDKHCALTYTEKIIILNEFNILKG